MKLTVDSTGIESVDDGDTSYYAGILLVDGKEFPLDFTDRDGYNRSEELDTYILERFRQEYGEVELKEDETGWTNLDVFWENFNSVITDSQRVVITIDGVWNAEYEDIGPKDISPEKKKMAKRVAEAVAASYDSDEQIANILYEGFVGYKNMPDDELQEMHEQMFGDDDEV